MIYIFDGIKKIFQVPGMLCSALGNACKSCPGLGKQLGGMCTSCGSNAKQYFERPLSIYFIVSCLLSYMTFSGAQADQANPKDCSSTFLFILMGFSAVNVIFAGYLCWKVWKEIESHQEEWQDGDEQVESQKAKMKAGAAGLMSKARGGAEPVAAAEVPKEALRPGSWIVPQEVVKESFKTVWMQDFGVLAMFFGLVGLVALCTQGPAIVDGVATGNATDVAPICKVSPKSVSSGYYFFFLAAAWSAGYYCCSCCSNKVYVSKAIQEEQREAAGEDAAQE
jgi:hypothetical protein